MRTLKWCSHNLLALSGLALVIALAECLPCKADCQCSATEVAYVGDQCSDPLFEGVRL